MERRVERQSGVDRSILLYNILFFLKNKLLFNRLELISTLKETKNSSLTQVLEPKINFNLIKKIMKNRKIG